MSKQNDSFETNIESLESILKDLESGGLSLSNALKSFEEGIGLYSSCLKILESANSKISLLEAISWPLRRQAERPGIWDIIHLSFHPWWKGRQRMWHLSMQPLPKRS